MTAQPSVSRRPGHPDYAGSTVGAAVVAVLAGAMLQAGPAAAATTTVTRTVATGQVAPMAEAAQTAAAAEPVCTDFSYAGYDFGGAFFCHYAIFPNEVQQVFLIGTLG